MPTASGTSSSGSTAMSESAAGETSRISGSAHRRCQQDEQRDHADRGSGDRQVQEVLHEIAARGERDEQAEPEQPARDRCTPAGCVVSSTRAFCQAP